MQTSKNVTVCDLAQQPYKSFKHNTTRYVRIPHLAPSLLKVQWTEACRVCVSSNDQIVVCEPTSQQGDATISLSDLRAPRVGPGLNLFHRTRQAQRLYAFKVIIQDLSDDHKVLATYEFHVLCEEDYNAAFAYKMRLDNDPKVIAPDLISDRVEGSRCQICKQVRKTLNVPD
jgi:hypothetical protein